VADVTLRQFESLAVRLRKDLDTTDDSTRLASSDSESMVSLARLMTVCLRVSAQVTQFQLLIYYRFFCGFASALSWRILRADQESTVSQTPAGLELLRGCILRTIYQTSATLGGAFARRRIVSHPLS